MTDSSLFEFKDETSTQKQSSVRAPWKVLSVEDDAGYQATLALALENLEVLHRPVQMLTANSAAAAGTVLAAHPDTALILLDVVMETDDAGLRLVGAIREQLGNQAVRIVLLTGQPGMSPRVDVMRRYDIDDYWDKAALGHDQLVGVVTSNLRTWDRITQLEQAKRGLLMVVEASQAIGDKRKLNDFAGVVLEEISRLLASETGGLICARTCGSAEPKRYQVVAGSGIYSGLRGRSLADADSELPGELLARALATGEHQFEDSYSLFCFNSGEVERQDYLTLVKLDRPLTVAEKNLVRVFAENVGTGFRNIALWNRLSELAYTDTDLRLPNRNRLKLALRDLSENQRRQAVLVTVHIDQFRSIIVSLGEGFLRELLASLGRVLHQAYEDHLIARFHPGGLALLWCDARPFDTQRLTELLQMPLTLRDGEHEVSTTVAVVPLATLDGQDADQLLSLAEITTGRARQQGLHCLEATATMEREVAEHETLLNQLRHALKQQRLYIVLQPKVRLEDGALVGFEALARWRLGDGTLVRPGRFVPLAETSGLVESLGRQVLEMTCDAVRQLTAAGIEVPVAFNASVRELIHQGYFQRLLNMVEAAGVSPASLELEVTESQALTDYEEIAPGLQRLIRCGMGVSIDDFGTGYSSLAHVARLRATSLKIDRSFITGLEQNPDDQAVVEMILRLGQRFGFQVVAEGVETPGQRQLLTALGCPLAQGFYFSRPLPVQEAISWALAASAR